MPATNPIAVTWLEDSSAIIMARIEDRPTAPHPATGTALVQSNLSAISYTVYDITEASSGTAPTAVAGHENVSLTVASVIFNTLQGWSVDATGHNFRTTILPTAFPRGQHRYRVVVKWTHTDGRIGHTVWEGLSVSVNDA